MKIIKNLLCVTVCSVGLITGVEAATLKIGDGVAKAGSQNNEVKISLTDEDLVNYNKVEFQLSVSNTFYAQVTGLQPNTGAGLAYSTSQSEGISTYSFESKSGSLSEIELGSVVFRTSDSMDSDIKITPIAVKFYKKDDGATVAPGDAGIKALNGNVKYERPKSSEAVLTNIELNSGTLTPAFDSTVTEYKVQVRDTLNYIRINPVPCLGATISGDAGAKALEMGENNFEITVTAEDGSTSNTYKLTVIRGEIAEPSAYLKDLVINNIGASLSPTFESKNNKYTVQIDKAISKLDFKYELEDPMAEVKIEGNENFAEGENLVKILVKSSDGQDEQVYEITVIKEEDNSSAIPVEDDKTPATKKKGVNVWLIVGIVSAIIVVVIAVAIILFRKNNKKKKEEAKLPLKRREGAERTVELNAVDNDTPKHAVKEDEDYIEKKEYPTEEESITEILKSELYEDDRTQKFDPEELKKIKRSSYDEMQDEEQTKEFDFKDF